MSLNVLVNKYKLVCNENMQIIKYQCQYNNINTTIDDHCNNCTCLYNSKITAPSGDQFLQFFSRLVCKHDARCGLVATVWVLLHRCMHPLPCLELWGTGTETVGISIIRWNFISNTVHRRWIKLHTFFAMQIADNWWEEKTSALVSA